MKSVSSDPRTKVYAEKLAEYSDQHKKHTITNKIGSDKIKKKKNGDALPIGKDTYSSRQCSAHIRSVYPQTILQDNEETEFCGNCRYDSYEHNECKLCFVEKHPKWQSTQLINFARSISGTASNNNRLSADIVFWLGTYYPNTYGKYSIIVVKRNNVPIIKYYIKLIPYSSMQRYSTPSGYKYKDRITLSKSIKIQNNQHKDIIFCMEDNVVHCVGFWGLLQDEDGAIRTFLQINQDNPLSVGFKCLIDRGSTDIQSIDVELICKQHDEEETKLLWHYDHSSMAPSFVLPPCINHNQNVSALRIPQDDMNGYEASRAPTHGVMECRMNPLDHHPSIHYNIHPLQHPLQYHSPLSQLIEDIERTKYILCSAQMQLEHQLNELKSRYIKNYESVNIEAMHWKQKYDEQRKEIKRLQSQIGSQRSSNGPINNDFVSANEQYLIHNDNDMNIENTNYGNETTNNCQSVTSQSTFSSNYNHFGVYGNHNNGGYCATPPPCNSFNDTNSLYNM